MLYLIGNGLYSLRKPFEANSDQEAWEIGRKLFNEARGGDGYIVYLSRREEIDQKHSSPRVWEIRGSQPHMFLDWQFTFLGFTSEPWPSDIPSNLFP